MRTRTRVILIVVLLLLIAAGLGLYRAATRYLPGFIREKIVTGLAQATQRRVTLDTVKLDWGRGIVIRNLRVYDRAETEKAVLSVDEVDATVILLPWGKESKVLLPSVRLYGARLDLIRNADGNMNIQDLIDSAQEPSSSVSWPIVRNLKITESEVVFVDTMRPTPATTMVRLLEATAKTSWDKVFIDADTAISFNGIVVPADVSGNYAYKERRLDLRLTANNIDPKPFLPYLPTLPFTWETGVLRRLKIDVTVKEGSAIVKPQLTVDGIAASWKGTRVADGTVHIQAAYEASRAHGLEGRLNGRFAVEKAAFHVSDPVATDGRLTGFGGGFAWHRDGFTVALSGAAEAPGLTEAKDFSLNGARADIEARIARVVGPDGRQPSTPDVFAKAKVSIDWITGLPEVGAAENVAGNVTYANGPITFSQVRGRILGQDVTAEGAIKDKTLDAALKATLPLSDVTLFLGKRMRLPKHEISGTAETVITIHRVLAENEKTQTSGQAAIRDLWIGLKKEGISLSAETGAVHFDIPTQEFDWDFNDVFYGNASYDVNGTVTDFRTPRVLLRVNGPQMNLRADAVVETRRIVFNQCFGRWRHTTFGFKGDWGREDRIAAIDGQAEVELADLAFLPESAPSALKKIRGQGPCRLTVRLKGPLETPVLWALRAHVASDAVRLAGYYIENIVVEYEQIDRQGFINNATFRAYHGEGLIKGRLDFTGDVPTFALRGTLDGLDLDRLKRDTPLNGKTFFGMLSVNASVQGKAGDLNSLAGGGHLTIKDGNVWEFNPLRGLGDFLFIPRFSSIVFSNAEGDYFIREGHVETANLTLTARELSLLIEGEVSFAGALDLLMNTQVPLGPAGKIEGISETVQTITKTGSLTAIHVTGTIQEPKYKLQAVAANIVKKFTDLFSSIVP